MKKAKNLKYLAMTFDEIGKHLTGQQKKFVEHFEITSDEMLSAQYAGYTLDPDKAAVTGARLIRNPKIKAYRHLRILDLYEIRNLSAEAVILRIDNLYHRSVQDVPHMTRSKETKEMEPDGTWVYDSKDAINTLKLLGNVYGIFSRKTDNAGPGETIEEFLQRMGEPDTEE